MSQNLRAPNLRVAFVGCGGMAGHYLGVYRDLDWVDVKYCIDVNGESAPKAAATFSADPPIATSDFNAALGPDIDAVIINTPNFEHGPQAIAAIAAGKHVLLQKPVAASLTDAEAIAHAAATSSKTVGLYMSYFDQPLVQDIREMVELGRLGDVVNCYARLMHRGGMMWSREALDGRPTWRGSIAQTGGGCFIQLAVHYIHLFEWFTGSRVVKATGFAANLHCPGIEGEDLASAILQLESGALITLDTAWCTDGEELAVHGTKGRILYRSLRHLSVSSSEGAYDGLAIHYQGGLTEAFGAPAGVDEHSEVVPPLFGDAANPLNQHRVFLEAARDGKPAPVSIASGVHDMQVVAAVYESARTGRVVTL
jgi:predicted dehydrogenase